jgi:hypothetical protein
MSGLDVRTVEAMMDELQKIAAVSVPSIKAPPAPGGDGTKMSATPASPVSPKAITAKALMSTNLQKTNYTSVGTKVPQPDVAQASEQKALQPPVVRS